jgi:hypothetical protein
MKLRRTFEAHGVQWWWGDNRIVPPLRIARRFLFCPIAFIGFAIFYLGVALGWGVGEAENMRRENF